MPNTRLEALLFFYEEDPEDAFVRFALAQEYLKLDQTDKALLFFENLVRDQPDYVGTYYHLGKLYERLQRIADAVQTYQTGIQMAEQYNEPHARSELQAALMNARGIGFDDEDEW